LNDNLRLSPASPEQLDRDLVAAHAIKAEMSQLLKDLEEQVTGKTQSKIGGWRHHPKAWAKENLN
jgi:hypothetical protein